MTVPHQPDLLERVVAEHGDSFYLADLDQFRANVLGMRDAFRQHYANTSIAYSYKTNYLPRLCRLVDDWGGYAEVVSGLEYDMAVRLGVDPRRIVFNGPYKTEDDIAEAVRDGALLNLDGPRQLRLLEQVLDRRGDGPAVPVGVRATFALDPSRPSRFGFDEADVEAVVDRLRADDRTDVRGLHCHFATGSRSTDAYRAIAERMVALADRCFPDQPPSFLDLGGGFYSNMPPMLREQFGGEVPSHDDYAACIGEVLAERWGRTGGPELVLEPGVSVTADVMDFVAEVLEVRTVNGRRIALVAGSIHNIKPTLNDMNMPMEVVHRSGAEPDGEGPVDVVGYTCMEHDVLHRGFDGPVAVGDLAVFGNAGAYTNVLKPPFIRAAAPIVAIGPDGTIETLRRAETIDDLLATYVG